MTLTVVNIYLLSIGNLNSLVRRLVSIHKQNLDAAKLDNVSLSILVPLFNFLPMCMNHGIMVKTKSTTSD